MNFMIRVNDPSFDSYYLKHVETIFRGEGTEFTINPTVDSTVSGELKVSLNAPLAIRSANITITAKL